ncbi:hypothetical protein C8Q78DRAFT_1083647 [Trametes maxima]|nr:hypothetical protein C8Q78DRAFT_1083647 [Trametes maxima]
MLTHGSATPESSVMADARAQERDHFIAPPILQCPITSHFERVNTSTVKASIERIRKTPVYLAYYQADSGPPAVDTEEFQAAVDHAQKVLINLHDGLDASIQLSRLPDHLKFLIHLARFHRLDAAPKQSKRSATPLMPSSAHLTYGAPCAKSLEKAMRDTFGDTLAVLLHLVRTLVQKAQRAPEPEPIDEVWTFPDLLR